MITSYLSLGSNLTSPPKQLTEAITKINNLVHTRVLKKSYFYWNSFIGQEQQPEVLNAVIAIETRLNSHELLQNLLAIELKHGRERKTGIRYSARTLDIDILLYGNEIINTPDLVIPHPRMTERPFVMFPLLEIAADLRLPSGSYIKDLVKTLEWHGRREN